VPSVTLSQMQFFELPAMQGIQPTMTAIAIALRGSSESLAENEHKKGTTLSFAIAASILGDPVSDCSAAPTALKNIPTLTTFLLGQAMVDNISLSAFSACFMKCVMKWYIVFYYHYCLLRLT